MKILIYKDCTTIAIFNKVKYIDLNMFKDLLIRMDNCDIRFEHTDYDWFEVEGK